MKTKCVVFLAVIMSMPAFAGQDQDYLSYSIPADAVKVGPHPSRDPNKDEYLYFAAGHERSRENLVGIELVDHGVLVKRELLKSHKKHDVQREWYPNGKLRLEAPYKNGRMDGLFKVWDENGDLIGQYTMREGAGTAVVYDSQGQLAKEDHYKNDQREGLRMERIGDRISLTWSSGDRNIGKGYDFFLEDGQLATISFFSDGQPSGPVIEFAHDGTVTRASWFLHNREVTQAEYATSAATDSSLPPYYSDVSQYKELVDPNVRPLLETFLKLPKVKIPLEFDQKGNPVRQ